MTYIYTDHLDWALHVAPGAEEGLIQARDREGNAIGIKSEDAPAVALAILEAAGCADGLGEYVPGEMRAPVHVAVERLRQVRADRARRIEERRMNEDQIKARALREAAAKVMSVEDGIPWDHDHDRATVACWLEAESEALERS